MSIHEIIPIEILVMILRELDHESIKVASVVCKNWRQIIEKFELKNPFIIVFGGVTCRDVPVDVISGGLRTPKIPKFPFQDQFDMIYDCTMTNHFGTILVCGGQRISQELKGKTWAKHSNLIKMRFLRASAITTKDTTFLFGGDGGHSKTYEYLPKGSTEWRLGTTEIPEGFKSGSAILISDDEIWLIGGENTEKRILSFDVKNHVFSDLPITLNIGRELHRCEFIPSTKKIIITGGYNRDSKEYSTEIIDVENKSVRMGNPMNYRRSQHGIGIISNEGKNVIAVFGGESVKSKLEPSIVEIYNPETLKWEISTIKLKEHYMRIGFLSLT